MNDIRIFPNPHHVQIEVRFQTFALDIPGFPPGKGVKLRQSHDEAVHLAAALVEASLLRCSPELREKFNNLVRDIQK